MTDRIRVGDAAESVGVRPANFRKATVNELVSLKPSSNAMSVTDMAGSASSIFTRLIRRLT